MPKAKSLLIDAGMTFSSGYVTTPICCPSRTATISGRYAHNLEDSNPAIGWCGDFTGYPLENETWINALHEAGYATSLSGKYHNEPPTSYAPKGYDDFFALLNECQYFNNSFNANGVKVSFGDAPEDYMTSVIGNHSLAFLRKAVANASSQPFFAYIAPHAPHMPTTVAPWYWNAPLPSTTAPRTPAYNTSGEGKQWVISELPPLNDAFGANIDKIFADRHRALLSVDDIVEAVMEAIAPVADNTYVIYTSDHGYNLGTFRIGVEKFHLLENDVNVPFYVRGPGVPAGSRSSAIVANIDIGASILDLAGVAHPTETDGRSFAQALTSGRGGGGVEDGGAGAPSSDGVHVPSQRPPRDRIVIEYWGGGYVVRGPCNVSCGICPPELSQIVDAPSNTYSGLRIQNATHDVLYAEFRPFNTSIAHAHTNWTELYNISADPFQLKNIAQTVPPATLEQYSRELFLVANCVGADCP